MFSLLMEKLSEDDLPGEAGEEEEGEEEEQPPDENTVFFNEEINSCFALFDKNKTGAFETKFLEKALKCLGIFINTEEIMELRESIDRNGFIRFEDFQEYTLQKLSEMKPQDALTIAFQTFDHEDDGFLYSDRMKRWLTTLGDPLTDKEVKEFIKLADPGGNGRINYIELVPLLLI